MRAGVLKLIVALAATALIAGACSGGDDSSDEAEEDRSEETTTTTEPAPAEPDDPAAAEAEIRANFGKVFDSETPEAEAMAFAEDVEEITPTMKQAQAASPGGHRTIAVKSVTFTSETTADVVFDILLEGNPLLPGFGGGAIFEDGVWKVTRKTNCDLAALAGFSCP